MKNQSAEQPTNIPAMDAEQIRAAVREQYSTVARSNGAVEQEQHNVERDLAAYVAVFVSMLPSLYREALTAMKSRVQRGRQQLRAALEDCCKIALDARGQVLQCEPRPQGSLGTRCE